MKIMVTGAGGFVGSRLAAYYGKKYDVWGVTHKDLDLTNEAAVFKTVENYHPDVLIHCAAISDVAECSKKPELSHAVNVLGMEYLAKACGKTGTKLVMCSSDQVYFRKRGEQESLDAYLEPHREDCSETPEPLYGKQKLQGEEICLKYQPESVVLRLSWMYDNLTEERAGKRQTQPCNDASGNARPKAVPEIFGYGPPWCDGRNPCRKEHGSSLETGGRHLQLWKQ